MPETTSSHPSTLPKVCRTQALPGASNALSFQGAGLGRVSSAQLLGHRRVLEIVHEQCIYQLRLTSSGKLILTK